MSKTYLTCKNVEFYSEFDETAFFEWIKKINCIENIEGSGDELYLDISSPTLQDDDLRELIAILYRYNINMKQLSIFLNDNNKKWFARPSAYWYNRVFC